MADTETDAVQIGWQIVAPDGTIIDSGPVTIAEMSGDLAELLGVDPTPEGA